MSTSSLANIESKYVPINIISGSSAPIYLTFPFEPKLVRVVSTFVTGTQPIMSGASENISIGWAASGSLSTGMASWTVSGSDRQYSRHTLFTQSVIMQIGSGSTSLLSISGSGELIFSSNSVTFSVLQPFNTTCLALATAWGGTNFSSYVTYSAIIGSAATTHSISNIPFTPTAMGIIGMPSVLTTLGVHSTPGGIGMGWAIGNEPQQQVYMGVRYTNNTQTPLSTTTVTSGAIMSVPSPNTPHAPVAISRITSFDANGVSISKEINGTQWALGYIFVSGAALDITFTSSSQTNGALISGTTHTNKLVKHVDVWSSPYNTTSNVSGVNPANVSVGSMHSDSTQYHIFYHVPSSGTLSTTNLTSPLGFTATNRIYTLLSKSVDSNLIQTGSMSGSGLVTGSYTLTQTTPDERTSYTVLLAWSDPLNYYAVTSSYSAIPFFMAGGGGGTLQPR